jgi:hypothetical protein
MKDIFEKKTIYIFSLHTATNKIILMTSRKLHSLLIRFISLRNMTFLISRPHFVTLKVTFNQKRGRESSDHTNLT